MGRAKKLPEGKAISTGIELDAHLVEGFVRTFLHDKFDSPKETPKFHRELWSMCCNKHPYVDIAAPRGHAKSTAGTLSFGLASLCFGFRDNVLLLSATEKQAVDHVQEMRIELTENDSLIDAFNIHGFSKENEAEFICHIGGRVVHVIAKGAGQKLRGSIWRNKRPNLILVDDLEEDEAVRSRERRIALAHWFTSAVIPLGADNCLIRMFGTILHEDSLLNNLLKDGSWLSRSYKAHEAFDDFSNILWPEKFNEQRLRDIRQKFINLNNPSGYSQEYLNLPVAEGDQYFRPEWFVAWKEEDRGLPMRFYSGIDFAISESQRADKTAIVTVGVLEDGRMVFVDCRAGRWDSLNIIEQMFDVHRTFKPELFICEEGAIRKAIGPFLNAQMIKTGVYINIDKRVPVKDKFKRAVPLQARFKAGGILVDKESAWYPEFYHEMISFQRGSGHDDRVDAAAWIGTALEDIQPSSSLEEMEDEDYSWEELNSRILTSQDKTTGY